MASVTRQVPLYGVHFKGIFGRNRSVKFKANRDLVERPADVDEATFVAQIADRFASDIKPKDGRLDVVVYPEGEVTVYSGADGINGRDYTLHTYQPFGARVLARRGYIAGAQVEVITSNT